MTSPRWDFCRRFVFLKGRRINFDGRPYLPPIYASDRNLVLRCGRQTEKSTFLANVLLERACRYPGSQSVYIMPRQEQAEMFCRTRLIPPLLQSPLICRRLLGTGKNRPRIRDLEFRNGSAIFIRNAFHSGDAVRGISCELLVVDESQDTADGDLPVLMETLSHAAHPRVILAGTPKSVENHLESWFGQSTACEWTMDCSQCGKAATPNEHAMGPFAIWCPACHASLDRTQGRWVARHPDATWDGFWISQLMAPWINHQDLIEKQRRYDPIRFKNESLGLPTTMGDLVATREELEACCGNLPMAGRLAETPPTGRGPLIAGLDWGGGGTSRTVLVIGYMQQNFIFHVCRLERFAAREHPDHILNAVAQRCRDFQIRYVAADGMGNGHVYNRMLALRLPQLLGMYAIQYSVSDQRPEDHGLLWTWAVNRSATIGVLFHRIKEQKLRFPRLQDSATFLEEFACEITIHDAHKRAIIYTKPDTAQDDALHATNYALMLATRSYHLHGGANG